MSDFSSTSSIKREGEENAKKKKKNFETFFRLTYERLCNFAFGYVDNRDIAEDIVQSTFLNVWETKEIWDDFENAKAYMFKSVRNKALNYQKHESVKHKSEPEVKRRINEWNTSQDANAFIKRKLKTVRAGVQQLPERRREIFKMSRENGLTYREIAENLDISIKTVETQIGRSLKFLRSYVAEHYMNIMLLSLLTF
jgi:RNA polymerase sigma-70 factor (ECF subfamily)